MALDQNIKNQLIQYMAMIKNPIEIIAYKDESNKSEEMLSLLYAIKETTNLISVVEKSEHNGRTP